MPFAAVMSEVISISPRTNSGTSLGFPTMLGNCRNRESDCANLFVHHVLRANITDQSANEGAFHAGHIDSIYLRQEAMQEILTRNSPAKSGSEGTLTAVERIEAYLRASPMVLFMKGTLDFPQCGFSV
jgi:hypothetical protein